MFVENFSYTAAATLVGNGNWAQTGTTATNPIAVSGTGLTYAGYSGSGVGNAVALANTGQDVNTPFANSASISTGNVYCSFMLNISAAQATGDYFFHFANPVGTTSNFYSRVFAKSSGTGYNIGLSKSSSTADYGTSPTVFDFNTTYLVVVKYSFNSASAVDDSASVYVFSSGVPATEPTTPTVGPIGSSSANSDAAAISSIALRQGNATNAPTLTIDGFRVATDWFNAPLPVSLKSFNASLINNKVALNWNTTNEINVDGFSIEKSNDARSFSSIGFVVAKNAAFASYSFNDVLAAGVNYYRLKITDKDGSFKYSSVVAVNAKQSTKLDIFPNPVVNTATLSHTKAGDNATVKLITIDGKTVLTQNIQAGATQSSIDVSKLIKGNYLVVFENDGNRTSLQFVKQ